MRRLLALASVLALGCASQPGGHAADPAMRGSHALATAPVEAGPPPCALLAARIASSQEELVTDAHTWLGAPERMAERRRLRALQARATELGCEGPRSF
jgi:hypothetical protein